jgi:murein L,D-transpeptidase YafK
LKSERRLLLLRGEETLKAYTVVLGREPRGRKMREGDGRTPEGSYHLDWRNPKSRFHLSLHVSYPNESDRARAAAAGVPPGGDIMIHGLRNGLGWIGKLHRFVDWTDGCIAVTSHEIEEIWRAVDDGTPIEIRP